MRTKKQKAVIAVVGILALVVWFLVAPVLLEKADGATAPTSERRDRHHYDQPRDMRRKFNHGRYDNARGIHLPPGTFRLAKRWCTNHPQACPRSTPTRDGRGDGCCWDWLEWTGDALKTTSCLAIVLNYMWTGCDDQPEWVHDVRKVEVLCTGVVVIYFLSGSNPAVAGVGGSLCFWEGVQTFFEGALREPA